MNIPGRGQLWGHGRTLPHDLSSVESQCVWIYKPVIPGPESGREGRKERVKMSTVGWVGVSEIGKEEGQS